MKRYLMNKSEDKKTQETGVNDFLLSDVSLKVFLFLNIISLKRRVVDIQCDISYTTSTAAIDPRHSKVDAAE